MRGRILLLAGLAWAGTATAAQAATTFPGRTSQGRTAQMDFDDAGAVTEVAVRWRSGCRHGGASVHTRTRFLAPFPKTTPDAIGSRGVIRERDPDGKRLTYRVAMTGKRVSSLRWEGTFSARVVVRRGGKVVNRCRSGRITWIASQEDLPIDVTSDAGDPILGGTTRVLRYPPDYGMILTGRRSINVLFGAFILDLKAPRGRRLRKGTTFATSSTPASDELGRLFVADGTNGCDSMGRVTVDRAAFDRRGVAERLTLRFEQRCFGAAAGLRGVVRYVR